MAIFGNNSCLSSQSLSHSCLELQLRADNPPFLNGVSVKVHPVAA